MMGIADFGMRIAEWKKWKVRGWEGGKANRCARGLGSASLEEKNWYGAEGIVHGLKG